MWSLGIFYGEVGTMKPWLSPWVLPLVMLGAVLVLTRPVAGAIWTVGSVLLVRLLNGHCNPPVSEELRRPYEDPRRSYLGAFVAPYDRTRS